MIYDYIRGIRSVLVKEEVKDILFLKGAIKFGDTNYSKMSLPKFRRMIAKRIDRNKAYINEDDSEIYIGTFYESPCDLYPVKTNEINATPTTIRAIVRSLTNLGVSYVGDINPIEVYTSMKDDIDFMGGLGALARRTIILVDEDGKARIDFYKMNESEDLRTFNINKAERSEKKREILREMASIYQKLEDHSFVISSYSYPSYEDLSPHDRFFISNLTNPQYQFVNDCFEEINNMGQGVAELIYDAESNDRELLDLFHRFIELIYTL